MDTLVVKLSRLDVVRGDLDYPLIRAAMVIVFLFFGYQKWFEYEAQALIPFISSGPLISWLYPAFGLRGASYFLGVAEWLFGALLFLGFWNKKLGILGALGSCATFVATITIIPFIPNGWAAFCSKPLVVSIDSKGKPSKPECPECRSKSMLRPKQR